jgi:ribonuclease Z
MMRAFEWQRWPWNDAYSVQFHRIPARPRAALITTPEFSISTAPTTHLLPTIAVRVTSNASKQSITYSSDTQVCAPVVDLARGSDILFHEATTLSASNHGHTSARQAGAQAARAGARKLVLVHLPPHCDVKKWRAAAQKSFRGQVVVGKDFARFQF